MLKSVRTLATLGAIVLFFALLLFSLQNVVSFDDGLRHFAMATFMSEHGIAANTGWGVFLYHGVMSTLPADPWFFYDVLLIPLTGLQPDDALKIVSLLAITLISVIFFALLRTLRVPRRLEPWYLLALFFGDFHFVHRILLGRPFPFFTALVLLVIFCLFQRQWILLAVTLAASVLLSHLFIFPLTVSVLGIVWFLFYRDGKSALRTSYAVLLGIGLGLAIHPQSFAYLRYLTTILPLIPFQRQLALGSELEYGFFGDAKAVIVMLGLIAIFLALFLSERKNIGRTEGERRIFFLLGLFVCVGSAYLLWLRVIDLLWPLALLTLAALQGIDPQLSKKARLKLLPDFVRPWFAPVILATYFFITAGLLTHFVTTSDLTRTLENFSSLQSLPMGSKVLNLDWDLIPVYLTVRPDLEYATGMDPTFTYLADPEASSLLHMPRSDTVKFDPPLLDAARWVDELTQRIPSDYFVLRRDRNKNFIEELLTVPQLKPLSASGAIAIFEIEKR